MRGQHPTLHQLLSNLNEKIRDMEPEKAYQVVRCSLNRWKAAEGLKYKGKPGRPAGLTKKTRIKVKVLKAAKELYQENGVFPTIIDIINQLDEPASEATIRRYCGTMKDIANAIGASYPKIRTDTEHLNELYKGNDPVSVLLSDLYQVALQHPEMPYVLGLINSRYTKYSDATYRKYIGNAQQIANALRIKYNLNIRALRKPGRKR